MFKSTKDFFREFDSTVSRKLHLLLTFRWKRIVNNFTEKKSHFFSERFHEKYCIFDISTKITFTGKNSYESF